MNGLHWIMLGIGIVYVFSVPVVLTKAILRREKQRVFELLVNSVFVMIILADAFAPAIAEKMHPVLRWVLPPAALLFIVNWFGFSGWLFNRRNTPLA